MKTSLHFEAPTDLSVGTVRITGHGQTIADWVATPDNRTFQRDDLRPGVYSVEIGPAGVAPQSVVFEVREGQANNVVLPSFSALSSSGSNTSFFDMDGQRAVSESPFSIKVDAYLNLGLTQPDRRVSHDGEKISGERARQIDIPTARRRVSIGLSEEALGPETFATFDGQSKMELSSGRLELEIPTDSRRDHWAGHRVRLSAAIEKVRVERCLLPLYRGGTRITVAAPSFSAADLELSITPVDTKLRALVRALDAGTSIEAAAVRDDVIGRRDAKILLVYDADPWAALLFGLLTIRFPDVFGPADPVWTDHLVERAGWAFDAHVIRASQALSAAAASSLEARNNAVSETVGFLAKAQVAGSPYYRYTNQLFGEMAAGVASYLKVNNPRIDKAVVRRFERLHSRWHRELPLQRGSGSTFTWLARDLAALRERNVLVPHRHPSGRLQPRHTRIVFEGEISAGQIAIIGRSTTSEQTSSSGGAVLSHVVERSEDAPEFGWAQMPALRRPPGPQDDPNKGRFGGEARRGGFRLSATFEPTKSKSWVAVILTIEADRSMKIALGDFAWFVLHPTFSPSALKVSFRGSRARLRIQSKGGFTVGVWVPRYGIELETDLAQIDGAPRIIKLL